MNARQLPDKILLDVWLHPYLLPGAHAQETCQNNNLPCNTLLFTSSAMEHSKQSLS